MITIVDVSNRSDFQFELEQAFQLRHQVFVDEKGWEDLRQSNDREVDQFDDDRAVHMLFRRDHQVVGYQRMLPTTQPHLLSSIYPQLCEDELPFSSTIWEWTRFAVAKTDRKRGNILSPVGLSLLTGIVEWGLRNEIDSIVIEMNPIWILRLLQLRFRTTPLGPIMKIGGEETIAVRADFSNLTLVRLQELMGCSDSVIKVWPHAQPQQSIVKIL